MRKIIAAIGAALTAVAFLHAAGDATATPKADCDRVAATDRKLCTSVRKQHTYAYPTESGTVTVPRGAVLIHELTHDGLSGGEMHAGLVGMAREYRAWVTAVPVNMDAMVRTCGNTDGQWVVGYRDSNGTKPGGDLITHVYIDCA